MRLNPTSALILASVLVGSVGQSAHPSYWRITSVPRYGESAGSASGARPPKLFSGLPMDTHDTRFGSGAPDGSAAQRRRAE